MIDKKKKYKLGDFNYSLPKKFIAQHPVTRRDYAKLMVIHKNTGEIEHRKFYNIVDYMRKNDLSIRVDLGLGTGKARVWGCDFTKEYIAINADYRS